MHTHRVLFQFILRERDVDLSPAQATCHFRTIRFTPLSSVEGTRRPSWTCIWSLFIKPGLDFIERDAAFSVASHISV